MVLNRLTTEEKKEVLERAEHVREMLTGYRSGSEDRPRPDEPRSQYAPGIPLKARYEAKAAELGASARSMRRWARAFRELGEAGLVPRTAQADGGLSNADPRWVETAVEVLKGYIEVPRDPHLAFEFLDVTMRTVQPYGVEINGRCYNGDCLDGLRDMGGSDIDLDRRRLPPFRDPDDATRIHFRDHEGVWHTLEWEHARSLDMPLSEEPLQFARRLAAKEYTYPDDRLAIALLLKRWNLGLGTSLVERRMALRLSREQAALELPETQADAVSSLPSVARVLFLPESFQNRTPSMTQLQRAEGSRQAGDPPVSSGLHRDRKLGTQLWQPARRFDLISHVPTLPERVLKHCVAALAGVHGLIEGGELVRSCFRSAGLSSHSPDYGLATTRKVVSTSTTRLMG
ncbi:hypothetical protein [Streptomyces sp. NPDC048496]|uniref:hypothetical protein n=1 Tax=Streptomyces sp. NPDC048496 TaxID=3365558 RepID=UPI00371EC377